jgi:S-adenosylmethionine:tRNA ribosyltransferase-isomerase
MLSAGRAFTPEIVARLRDKGVRVAPLVLHTGVSSLDVGEPPYPERYRVAETARVDRRGCRRANRRCRDDSGAGTRDGRVN